MATLKFVQSVWESFRASSGLEARLLDELRITGARPGRVTFRLPIAAHHLNRIGTLHGGTLAAMVDTGGSLAVASRGMFATGVSTDLNVTYLAPGGKAGDVLTAEVECDRFGKTLCYTRATFWNAKGQIAARGSHTKYVAVAVPDERNRIGELEKAEREREHEEGKTEMTREAETLQGR